MRKCPERTARILAAHLIGVVMILTTTRSGGAQAPVVASVANEPIHSRTLPSFFAERPVVRALPNATNMSAVGKSYWKRYAVIGAVVGGVGMAALILSGDDGSCADDIGAGACATLSVGMVAGASVIGAVIGGVIGAVTVRGAA